MNAREEQNRAVMAGVLADAEKIPARTAANSVMEDGPIIARGSDINVAPIRWVWNDWLAHGKMHLIAGAPGQGKTTIALAMAATVSAGGRWPDGTPCKRGNVLIYSGEDDPGDTLAPRLLAAGADLSRCYFVTGAYIDGERRAFDPARDMIALQEKIGRIGEIALLIVDPIVGAVTGDSHKNTETRRDLQPLTDLAAMCDCALIGITHFSKGSQGVDPAMRVIGSVAFTALARIVMVAAKVKSEDDKPMRILARAKSNVGPDDGGFEYHLEQTEVKDGIFATRIAWGNAVKGTARELLTDPDAEPDDDAEDAETMLRQALTSEDGTPPTWTPANDASKSLQGAGFTKKQIRTARKKLGVICRKSGFESGWYWRLPGGADPAMPHKSAEGAPVDAQGADSSNGASWAPSAANGASEHAAEQPNKSATDSVGGLAAPMGGKQPDAPARPNRREVHHKGRDDHGQFDLGL